MVGDLLLCWLPDYTPEQGRNEVVWQLVGQQGNGRLWQQLPSSQWHGSPLHHGMIGEWHYWLLGELFGSGPEQISAVLNGRIPAHQLNGHFLLCAWHSRECQWHIWTSRLGTYHLYYGTNGRQTALSTFCPAVAQAIASHELDWVGLAGFFSWGFFPQEHTHYEAVRMVPPATHLVLDENGRICQQNRYWQWHHQPDNGRSYNDTVAEFAAIFAEVLAEQTANGRIALPISGGLDSRTIVAGLKQNGQRPTLWPYSYGYTADSLETDIGQQIAKAAGLLCHSYTIKPYLFAQLNEVVACVEGFQDVTQCRQAAVAQPLRQNADAVLAGHWGDVWLDDMGVQPTSDLADVVLAKLEKRGRGWLLDNFGLQQQAKHLRQQVATDLAGYAHLEDPDFRVKAFKTDHWSWRWTTASLRMFQTAVFPRLPFYDNRLVDFFTTVPTSFVVGRRLQIDYLKRYAPELAQIIWQPYRANLYHYQYFHSWLLPARAWRKMRRFLSTAPLLQRNWEVQFLGENGRQQLHHLLLSPNQPLHEYLPPATIQALLDSFYSKPDGANGYTLSMLLTFAAWQKQYG